MAEYEIKSNSGAQVATLDDAALALRLIGVNHVSRAASVDHVILIILIRIIAVMMGMISR